MIEAQKAFTLNGKYYEPGDEVKVNKIEEVVVLNEKGYIKPLGRK